MFPPDQHPQHGPSGCHCWQGLSTAGRALLAGRLTSLPSMAPCTRIIEGPQQAARPQRCGFLIRTLAFPTTLVTRGPGVPRQPMRWERCGGDISNGLLCVCGWGGRGWNPRAGDVGAGGCPAAHGCQANVLTTHEPGWRQCLSFQPCGCNLVSQHSFCRWAVKYLLIDSITF